VIAIPSNPVVSETFIQAHIERLPCMVVPAAGWPARIGGRAVLSWPERALHKAWRMISKSDTDSATRAYLKLFRRYRPSAVLAEYGTMGVQAMRACREADVPLVVHFHGFDAYMHEVTALNAEAYPMLFRTASAVIAVSRPMQHKLISLGASPGRTYRSFCGVDCREFCGGDPAESPPNFIAVGRFTAKKAPDLTLGAFARVHRVHTEARLTMIGDGSMLAECRRLARDLGVAEAVTFLGPQPASVVQAEMRRARCLVQHSVVAPSGDAEGTPISIIEAGATGLPVVSTCHAGIPDIVVEGVTGFLVPERDVEGMSARMLQIARDPELAGRLGQTARLRIERHFSIEKSIDRLWRILQSCMREEPYSSH
jgi:glycosyltransferase involved in cell wall biosynthesis